MTPIEKLESYRTGALPRSRDGRAPKLGFSGAVRGLRFIVTEDHDGQIELSLSCPGGRRVTPAQAKAFFRWWGLRPWGVREDLESCAFWVVRRGRVN
ncbi:hypothetical protein N0B44_15655 [Roseibacterium beibuensis]|uniref:Uncharacterized protein n=1 Tax=[Roseibacterium] beibuensis TaxID=1193142 RepID=A0ABP9L8U9_9RHOB|nr:hypothetical protein [Roseibacterium beibuensis]MCS6624354.1 hypothetical protein [Roseibacterium beibuensis]